MKMVITIGYSEYVIDPRDAILLLDIAQRAIKVSRPEWGKPYRQTGEDDAPFISKAELVDYEPLALPGPFQAEPQPPEEIPF